MYIQLRNITKIYNKSLPEIKALDNINLEISDTEKILIIGQSGAGKTTLLNILSLSDLDFEGEYILKGKSVHKMTNKELSKFRSEMFSIIHQEYALIEDETVCDNIKIPLLFSSYKSKEYEKLISKSLEKVGLLEYKSQRVDKLSGGQRQRVAIARALVKESKVLLADEPLSSMEKELSEDLLNIIYNNSSTLIYISHHLDYLENYQFRTIKLNKGKLITD